MKIIKPSFLEIKNTDPQKHIEEIARTCYKSENKITDKSNKQICKNLYNNKHWAMLEHYIFCYQISNEHDFDIPIFDFFALQKYVNITYQKLKNDHRIIISFSARSLLDIINKYFKIDSCEAHYFVIETIKLIEKIVYDYNCDEIFGNRFKKVNHEKFIKIDNTESLTIEEQMIHGWKSIKFTCDRGVSHEIVRHRDASFAQESTRYCNYAKDKFGKEITVIKPLQFNDEAMLGTTERQKYNIWKEGVKCAEETYFRLLNMGASAQEARAVLPNSLKTEIIMTARNYEWKHFFELRCDNAAHPQMRELAIPLFDYFNKCDSTLFNKDIIRFEE